MHKGRMIKLQGIPDKPLSLEEIPVGQLVKWSVGKGMGYCGHATIRGTKICTCAKSISPS
jgi:hypothetical protein